MEWWSPTGVAWFGLAVAVGGLHCLLFTDWWVRTEWIWRPGYSHWLPRRRRAWTLGSGVVMVVTGPILVVLDVMMMNR